jgi:MoaA/NifB/PqqE/SkfB family radical SAM enzyme
MNSPRKGPKSQNMSFHTFKKALSHDDSVVLGGGEPTLHPHFEKFLLYAIAHCTNTFVVTNGKIKQKALMLARLNGFNPELFHAELSQDPFHEPINPKVVQAFGKSIRDTSNHLSNSGRCDFGHNNDCICDGDAFVKPNGDVHQCGCLDSPKVGDVFNGYQSIDDGNWNCHRDIT